MFVLNAHHKYRLKWKLSIAYTYLLYFRSIGLRVCEICAIKMYLNVTFMIMLLDACLLCDVVVIMCTFM